MSQDPKLTSTLTWQGSRDFLCREPCPSTGSAFTILPFWLHCLHQLLDETFLNGMFSGRGSPRDLHSCWKAVTIIYCHSNLLWAQESVGSIRLGDGERPGSHSTVPARVCSGPLIKFLSLSQRAEEATFDPVHLYLAKNNNSHNDKHHDYMLAVCLMLHWAHCIILFKAQTTLWHKYIIPILQTMKQSPREVNLRLANVQTAWDLNLFCLTPKAGPLITQWYCCCCVSLSVVSDSFSTPWTVALQASLSIGFPRQEYWGWVAISFSRRSSQPWDRTLVSCIAGRFFTAEPPGKPPTVLYQSMNNHVLKN